MEHHKRGIAVLLGVMAIAVLYFFLNGLLPHSMRDDMVLGNFVRWCEDVLQPGPLIPPPEEKIIFDLGKMATTTPHKQSDFGKTATNSYPRVTANIIHSSPLVFAYAHGTAQADGKFFIGMAARDGNPFPTNQLLVFTNPNDLTKYRVISIPKIGDIETMVHDEVNDKIYFSLSDHGSLNIMSIDPNTYVISTIVSVPTSTINIGDKPAITTDGKYVYGITNTQHSTVFKVGIEDGSFAYSTEDHIPTGHSAAIGIYSDGVATTTELYFGGSMTDQFEKVSGETLKSLGKITVPRGCAITNDTPYLKDDVASGSIYLGCELQPYGYKVNSKDLTFKRFDLPGASFGMVLDGRDIYNAATDGHIDVFKNADITKMIRYDTGTDFQVNEIFHVREGEKLKLFFTAWWGIKGLYEIDIATSSPK